MPSSPGIPRLSPSPALGVTTVVIGNCGFGIAPATPATRDTLLRNLSEVEAMSLEALREGVDWQFDDFSSYLRFHRPAGRHAQRRVLLLAFGRCAPW